MLTTSVIGKFGVRGYQFFLRNVSLFWHLQRLHALRRGDKYGAPKRNDDVLIEQSAETKHLLNKFGCVFPFLHRENDDVGAPAFTFNANENIFLEPERHGEQALIGAILDAIIYDRKDRERLWTDPLVRLLIPNADGNYDFSIVTAMGVITEGREGTELQSTFERLERKRGVKTIRADTATARSFEYNAGKIIEGKIRISFISDSLGTKLRLPKLLSLQLLRQPKSTMCLMAYLVILKGVPTHSWLRHCFIQVRHANRTSCPIRMVLCAGSCCFRLQMGQCMVPVRIERYSD